MGRSVVEELRGTAEEMIKRVRKLIKEGSARRLLIKNNKGKTLAEVPLTAGVAGSAFFISMAPVFSAISLFALFVNDVNILVEKYPEEQDKDDPYEVNADYIEINDEDEEEE